MFRHEFFPTPQRIIERMTVGIHFDEIRTVLEPSAGRGDIVDYLKQRNELRLYRCATPLDIDTVEICADLQHVLRGKGIRVIHDDFLTFHTFKRYDLIIMNPPFSCGDRHLLKALDMQKNGGRIVCLLNAETLRNPYSNTRKDLRRQLEDLNAEVETIGHVFTDAERKARVEVVLVKINIPKSNKESIILEGLKRAEIFQTQRQGSKTIAHREFTERIVAQYNYEIKAGLALIDEYQTMQPLIKGSPLKLTLQDHEEGEEVGNLYIEAVRRKYWGMLFDSGRFASLLTSGLRDEFYDRIEELKSYDFSVFNILQIQEILSKRLLRSVEDTIIGLFDELSHKWHWADEQSRNIHYYNGWQTNKAWYINKKIIIPNMAEWVEYAHCISLGYRVYEKLQDIEKVLSYLDGGLADHQDLRTILEAAEKERQLRKIRLKYFTVSFFKKGTCHIEFTNTDLLKKLNLFGSQRKGWLPPSYGRVKYEQMTPEDRAVIDSFEGKEEYERVCKRKEYFFYKASANLLVEPVSEAG